MELNLIRHYCCWIASRQPWSLALWLLFPLLAYCKDGNTHSPDGRYVVSWWGEGGRDYHLALSVDGGPKQKIEMPEFEYRRENSGIANYDQRTFAWYFNRFLYSQVVSENENGAGADRLAGIGVVDANTHSMILNHEFNGVGKDPTSPRWCFVKYRARSQRTAWNPFEEPDQLGLLSFHKTATKSDKGECRMLWKELDGLVAANPQFSRDGKRIGVLVAKRLQPFCYILSSTDLKTISATALKGLKLEKRYLTEVVGNKYSGFLDKTLKNDYGF